jgi:centrosomal protein CEP104
MSNLTKLKFRVVFCSSEDTEFPVTELLKHGPQSKGWQSSRFQDFPQIIIFQFICPVQIQQLQFLSHQSKISSRIEIHTYMPESLTNVPPIEQFKWNRLGYLSLDNNEKSGFQARELKSVFIESKALYLKIGLNKCHVNKYNMFNQVGLIAVNALGEELGDLSIPSRKGLPPRLENELEFDPVTNERLKQLVLAKDRAVEIEDFDEAKRLREAIERLKSVGKQLYHLEDRKRQAINDEEYESAKVIKMEIDRLRNAVIPPTENNYFNRPSSGNQPMGLNRPASRPGPSSYVPQQVPPEYEPVSRPPKSELNSRPDVFMARNVPVAPKAPVSHDEQVIPTALNGKVPRNVYEDEDDNTTKIDNNGPESLGVQQSKQSEPFIHILGEDLCKKIFSRTWQFREEGLGEIQNELSKGDSSNLFGESEVTDVYTGVLGSVRYTIGDKIAQVSLKAMGLLAALIKNLPIPKSSLRGDSSEYLQAVLPLLLDKIGDNNPRVRETAEQSYMMLAKSDFIGPGLSVQTILKPMKEKSTSQKHNLGRLNLLVSMVEEFRIDNSYVPFQPIVDYALTSFTNSNSEIRNAAYNLLMVIYGCVGNKLMALVSDSKVLRPAQIELLQKGFSEIEVGSYQDTKPAIKAKETKQASGICEFCGKTDPMFSSQDNIDIHYWKDCPMLVACLQCAQIVEIIHLNSHMLKECELKELVKQCPRCKESVHIDEFEQHVEEQACLAAKPPSKANRCSLCHDDVDPGPSGWIKHIITEGCPNNDRSNY